MVEESIRSIRRICYGPLNGAMMTQRLMRFWPQKFAGFAPSAMESRNVAVPSPDDGYLRNVWYAIGEFDGFGISLDEGTSNYLTLTNICAANKIDFKKRRYYEQASIYIPLFAMITAHRVRFTGVKNWPHTYSPELAFMIYDEFFARFVRHADGTLDPA